MCCTSSSRAKRRRIALCTFLWISSTTIGTQEWNYSSFTSCVTADKVLGKSLVNVMWPEKYISHTAVIQLGAVNISNIIRWLFSTEISNLKLLILVSSKHDSHCFRCNQANHNTNPNESNYFLGNSSGSDQHLKVPGHNKNPSKWCVRCVSSHLCDWTSWTYIEFYFKTLLHYLNLWVLYITHSSLYHLNLSTPNNRTSQSSHILLTWLHNE